MTNVNLVAPLGQTFYDNAGKPAAGGKLFTYAAGTSTKQSVYTDSTGATPCTNPIILDATGNAVFWADSSLVYKYVVAPATDTDPPTSPFRTIDSVPGTSFDALLRSQLSSTTDTTKGVALVGGAARVVDSITALRALPKTGSPRAFVTGYYAAGDGGGGQYYYDSADTTSADNSGTIIVATDGGRWKLAYTEKLSVKQFGAKGDGVSSDQTATQAALNSLSSNGLLYWPPGVFVYTASLTLPNVSISIVGAGMGVSILRWTSAVTAALSATYTSIDTKLNVDNLSLQAGGIGNGIAISATWPVTASWTKVTFSSRNVEIVPQTAATHYWNQGMVLDYAWNAVIDNPHIRGKDNDVSMATGINLLNRSNDVCIKDAHIFFCAVGVQTGNLCEGTAVTGPRMVYVNYGVYSVPTADAPYLSVTGGHIAALLGGVVAANRSQSHIYGNTIYKRAEATGSFPFVQLTTSDSAHVHNNFFQVLGGATGSAVGVNIISGDGAQANNNTSNGADTCVQFGASATNYTAEGNRRIGGTATVVASGTGTNILRDNLPADTNGYQTFAANNATPDVNNATTGNFFTANTAATTITNFLNGFAGQVINVVANDANTTVQHNAAINLQGGVNFAMGAAAVLTLRKMDIWREIGRRTA